MKQPMPNCWRKPPRHHLLREDEGDRPRSVDHLQPYQKRRSHRSLPKCPQKLRRRGLRTRTLVAHRPRGRKRKKVPRILSQLLDTPEFAKAKELPRSEYDDLIQRDAHLEGEDEHAAASFTSNQGQSLEHDEITNNDNQLDENDAFDVGTPSKGTRGTDLLPRVHGMAEPREPNMTPTRKLLNSGERHAGLESGLIGTVSKLQLTAKKSHDPLPSARLKPVLLPSACNTHLSSIKEIVLSKLSRRRPIPLTGLEEAYEKGAHATPRYGHCWRVQ